MAQKVVLISDPGIDGAFAIALALNDPDLEVVGMLATPGNIPADQATKNLRIILDQREVVVRETEEAERRVDGERYEPGELVLPASEHVAWCVTALIGLVGYVLTDRLPGADAA